MDYFLFFESCIIGGTELLIEKLGNYYSFDGAHVVLVCNSIIPEMKSRLKAKNINVIRTEPWNDTQTYNNIIESNAQSRNVFCITFNWQCYVTVSRSVSVCKKTLLFSTHPDTLRTDLSYPISNFCTRLVSIFNFRDLIRTHRLILQDEQTVETICNCFGNKYKKELSKLIIRIPVDIPTLNIDDLNERSKSNDLNILTIARADFPFKGYILGLIKLMNVFEKAQLTIISYGPNENEIKMQINEMPVNVSNRIKLVGQTDFDLLEKFIKNSNLYIGMGTTVLDATLRGVLSIAVHSYTYEVVADDFFFNDVLSIIGYKNEIGHDDLIRKLINQVDNMCASEYYQNAIKGRNAVVKYYSTESVAKSIKSRFDEITKDRRTFSTLILNCFYRIRTTVSRILHKIRRCKNESCNTRWRIWN